jgi:DNA-binding response OmpR family regulator
MRIVIADQDNSFLESFQWFLRNHGHDSVSACDGLACLEAIQESEPDVLAIGSNLLWGGTEGVLSVLLQDWRSQNIPVLLLQSEQDGMETRRHPMVLATARPPYRFEDLARQLNFLAILSQEERRCEDRPETRFIANAIPSVEQAIWNA